MILLSVYDDEQYLFQAMRVGASGYLLKGISSDELVRQIEGCGWGDRHRRRPGGLGRRDRRPAAERPVLAQAPGRV